MAETLRDQLAEAEAKAAHLRNRIAAEGCAVSGHDWRHVGGKNAGCEIGNDCGCSVPVHECAVCGDCDYGDNPEAFETIRRCAEAYHAS